MPMHCANCGAPLLDTAKFCHRCGAPRGGGAAAAPAAQRQVLPWAVAAIALLCLLAFIVGSQWRRPAGPAAQQSQTAGTPQGARAVDISSMSPEERADRLFSRVMTYVSEGKSDSLRFFAPMAIQAMSSLTPLDAHRRYDLGLLGVVSGDGVMARAQADTILAAQPAHLLGLILAMRATGLQLDTLARRGYSDRFLKALAAERAKRLPEYIDHGPDIDAAVREADARTPLPTQKP